MLPDLRHVIMRNIFVSSNKCDFFGKSGCDKQSVEGVAVNHRQSFQCYCMTFADWKQCKTILSYLTNKSACVLRKFQLANTYLDSKFPNRSHAQIFNIGEVKNCISGNFRHSLVTIEKPDGGMSVQQIPPHLHIVLEIIKRSVKIVRHPYLPFQAAKDRDFFRLAFFRLNRELNNYLRLSHRHFTGNFNNKTAISRNFYSLCYGHGTSGTSNIA